MRELFYICLVLAFAIAVELIAYMIRGHKQSMQRFIKLHSTRYEQVDAQDYNKYMIKILLYFWLCVVFMIYYLFIR